MKAKNLMTTSVAVCAPKDPMFLAARLMFEHDCGFVPVVREGRPVGVITDRDICIAALMQGVSLAGMAVDEAMSREVHCCRDTDDVATIHAAMRKYQVRRLPVVNTEGQLVGIVSLNDLVLRTKQSEEVCETLAAVCEHREVALA